MKCLYSPEQIKNLYYVVQQTALFNITESIKSISFELDNSNSVLNENKFHIRIYMLKETTSAEKKCLEQFHQNLKNMFAKDVEIFFEVVYVEENIDILDLPKLEWKFYLVDTEDIKMI